MHPSILFYLGLCFAWLFAAVLILLGYHERLLGQAEPWKQYLAVGICLLMMIWNLVRIQKLRWRLSQQSKPPVKSETAE